MKSSFKRWVGLSLTVATSLFVASQVQAKDLCGGQPYAAGELLVRFSQTTGDQEAAAFFQSQQIQAQPRRANRLVISKKQNIAHIKLDPKQDLKAVIAKLSAQKEVASVEPNCMLTAEALPNDPFLSKDWGLEDIGFDLANPDNIWSQYNDASNVTIAVLDSGVDYGHPDLAGNIWTNSKEVPGNGIDDDGNGYVDDVHGYDFVNQDADPQDDYGHGTHIAGIIGARGNNNTGVAGINWKARIMVVKMLDENNQGLTSNVVEALEYAVNNGAKVINASWGMQYSESLEQAVAQTNLKGAILVTSAGNSGENSDQVGHYPSSFSQPNILAVASVSQNDSLSDFSNVGKETIDLAAPGDHIYSTLPQNQNGYGYFTGTSISVSYVTGSAAAIWSAYPSLSREEVIATILDGTDTRSYLASSVKTGGKLNLLNSLRIAAEKTNSAFSLGKSAGASSNSSNTPAAVTSGAASSGGCQMVSGDASGSFRFSSVFALGLFGLVAWRKRATK